MKEFKSHNIRAFTLLEIIIAMSISAVIGVYTLLLLDNSTKAQSKIEQRAERYNEIERTFLFLSNDIRQIAPRPFRDEYGDKQNNLMSDDVEGLTFTRMGRRNPAALPRSSLEKLNYRVEDGKLYRISYSYPDGMPRDLGSKRRLLEKVEKLSILFYQDEDWTDFWPPQNLDFQQQSKASVQLPLAVKVILELEDLGKVERIFVVSDRQTDSKKT
ncbi:MAG: type II secretion system minor pseudopilin GspJ [Enterobacterales bacterium]|nr:type II secretion system minor pseudopilin GspJ [Enterobacterales bacterium]